ncbi:hypothetical protein BC834DRAFT_431076 [Gloeopeniophorella convolvens]|nr:hypothetical protein BC834DRAFT_431076 [Gloeopeniophorella convolvens]
MYPGNTGFDDRVAIRGGGMQAFTVPTLEREPYNTDPEAMFTDQIATYHVFDVHLANNLTLSVDRPHPGSCPNQTNVPRGLALNSAHSETHFHAGMWDASSRGGNNPFSQHAYLWQEPFLAATYGDMSWQHQGSYPQVALQGDPSQYFHQHEQATLDIARSWTEPASVTGQGIMDISAPSGDTNTNHWGTGAALYATGGHETQAHPVAIPVDIANAPPPDDQGPNGWLLSTCHPVSQTSKHPESPLPTSSSSWSSSSSIISSSDVQNDIVQPLPHDCRGSPYSCSPLRHRRGRRIPVRGAPTREFAGPTDREASWSATTADGLARVAGSARRLPCQCKAAKQLEISTGPGVIEELVVHGPGGNVHAHFRRDEHGFGSGMGSGPWMCQCTARFTRDSDWRRHAMSAREHGGQGEFLCEFCGLSMSRNDALIRHRRNKHGGQNGG